MTKRNFVRGVFVFMFFLLLIAGKVFLSERHHFMLAEGYYRAADWKLAIREYDNTLHMYIPASPYVQRSAERLWEIAEMFEKQGKPDWALIAYSSIRSSFYASRSWYTPRRDWIARCEEKIADLNVKMLIENGSLEKDRSDDERKKFLHVMRVERSADPLWAALAETGLIGWILALVFLVMKGFDSHGKIRLRFAVVGILLFFCSLGIWIVSLLKA